MGLPMPPALDSAGKVMEQASVWEFLQRSGERALSGSAARTLLAVELNGKGASLISLLVTSHLPMAFIAGQR